jgi:acyl phosphate:glycerol-3-phosphate acyltransferase
MTRRALRFGLAAALGYGVGSIPVGVLVGRLTRGIDVREMGSHSMGMTNVLRTAGRGPAAVTLLLDIGKGAAAARLGGALGGSGGAAAGGLGAVVGHSWPAFARFRGGKSAATSFGVILVDCPPAALAALGTGLTALAVTRRMSVLSLAGCGGAVVTAAAMALRRRDLTALAVVIPSVAVVVLRHRENIDRLIRGVEPELQVAEEGSTPVPDAAPAG